MPPRGGALDSENYVFCFKFSSAIDWSLALATLWSAIASVTELLYYFLSYLPLFLLVCVLHSLFDGPCFHI